MATPDPDRPRSYGGTDYVEDGKKAEAATKSFLAWLGVDALVDVADDKDYQKKDVDFLGKVNVHPFGAFDITVEAKSDKHLGKSGNVLFEIFRVYLDAPTPSTVFRQGWSWFSESKCFCMWSPPLRLLYVMTADDLRLGVKKHLAEHAEAKIVQIPTDKTTITFAMLVPERHVNFHVFKHDGESGEWAYVRSNPEVQSLVVFGKKHDKAA